METRERGKLYLIGSYETKILGAKLPSYRQVFGHFLYLHKVEKKTVREASRDVVNTITTCFWDKAGIPVRASQHSIEKLETVFAEWKGLQKHKDRVTPRHKSLEERFVARLDDLFDIASADALTRIKISEDKEFLLSQRQKGRPGTIGSLDLVQTLRNKKTLKRLHTQKKYEERSNKNALENKVLVSLESSTSSSSEDSTDNEENVGAVGGNKAPKRGKINIMSHGLASALDRTQLSSRKATFVLSEAASSLGHNVASLNINRSSIQRTRQSHRDKHFSKLKSEFSVSVSLTVHWDGKLMEDLTSKQYVDRLPVIISGNGVEQLLGVPKIPSGTGEAQASAVIKCLDEWGIADKVASLCFDTAPSNTGYRSGACVLIEQKLKKDLLFLACRHHIMELIIGAAFETSIGVSSGPNVPLFKRFKDDWQNLNRDIFQPASTDQLVEDKVASSRNDILQFAYEQLEKQHVRDDYREFLELSVIFLGGKPTRGIRIQAPGAMHHARWMSKVLYTIKIWLFRAQFKMTASEVKGIRQMAVFSVVIYLKVWITAPLAVQAPLNDFTLMRKLLTYPESTISIATSKTFANHFWYLSEELVGLALFDFRVPIETKKMMIAAMQEVAPEHPPKRPRINYHAFQSTKSLEQFCTVNSKRLFQLLGLSQAFLDKDPSEWKEEKSFKDALNVVNNLAVINDRAERGVALIHDFNKKLTKGEDQLQFLLQVVSDHRRCFPDCSKKTILASTSSHP